MNNDKRDWSNVDGAIAFQAIDREAIGWTAVGEMMDAWADARKNVENKDSVHKDMHASINAWEIERGYVLGKDVLKGYERGYKDANRGNVWREEVLNECSLTFMPFHEDNPRKTLRDVIDWRVDRELHEKHEIDGAVYIARGRAQAISEMMSSQKIPILDVMPDVYKELEEAARLAKSWNNYEGNESSSHWMSMLINALDKIDEIKNEKTS